MRVTQSAANTFRQVRFGHRYVTGIEEAQELTHDGASTNGSDRHALPNVGAHEPRSLAIHRAPRPFSACQAPYCDWIARRKVSSSP
jgi:hypothetical protein